MINHQSPIPLYRQLAAHIEQHIQSGVYPPDSRIPSENDLAASFSLGRPTVRQALDFLVRQGLLEKQKGRGTFVRDKTGAVDLFSLAGTSAAFHARGISVERRLIAAPTTVSISSVESHPLAGSIALFIPRLFSVKKQPILVDEIWIDPDVFPGIGNIDFSARSLSETIRQRYYLYPDTCTQTFSLAVPPDEYRKKLDTPVKAPVLLVKRLLGFGEHAHAIYSRLWCRTDTYQFSQKIYGT